MQAHMHVVIGLGQDALVFFVSDVDAACKADVTVNHHNLAVGAKVDDRPCAPPQPGRVEQCHFSTCGFQLSVVPAAQPFGAQCIDQQTHPYPFARLGAQQGQQGLPGLIGLKDVVLQMHMVLCLAYGSHDAVKSCCAAHQQLHLVGCTERQITGCTDQLDQLVQVGRRRGHFVFQTRNAGTHAGAAATAQALEALAFQTLGAEKVIHPDPDHRNHGHGQQPAECGDRRAALEQDPDRHNHHVQRPQHGQSQHHMITREPLCNCLHDRSSTKYRIAANVSRTT